ncbi:MAG: hypothetical protein JO101_04180, partial [Candidatus Eremiobacteraeota bacterium]|nr:hypothetical protein [Candidatus Eremiobacteraeota bacterium]
MRRFLIAGSAAALCAALFCGNIATADTLYVAPPAPVGAGHPLRLGPDHRAAQPGDIVYVIYDFSATTTSTSVVTQNKSFTGGIGPGTGIGATSILRFPTALSGQSA